MQKRLWLSINVAAGLIAMAAWLVILGIVYSSFKRKGSAGPWSTSSFS
jgi:hypothetical protein